MVALQALAVEGTEPTNESLSTIQKKLQMQVERREVQRILALQVKSADQLDLTLKLKKAKEKQALQNRLLQRKEENNRKQSIMQSIVAAGV